MNVTKERWLRLWDEARFSGNAAMYFDDLMARYSQPHRHYHNVRHIEECLAEFDAARHLASQPLAVELAIWYHDAVYDTHAADNEELSAQLAQRCLSEAGASSHLSASVTDLVLATKTHDGSKPVDGPLMVDIDLSILGKPEGRFWEYEAQIRKEYNWVPEAAFAAKRAEILHSFLERGRIYATDWFYRKYEDQARSNLPASIRKLRGVV